MRTLLLLLTGTLALADDDAAAIMTKVAANVEKATDPQRQYVYKAIPHHQSGALQWEDCAQGESRVPGFSSRDGGARRNSYRSQASCTGGSN